MGKTEADQLAISEIFYSIQGESSFAGLPCLFFRLHGCNLRCSYCDTRYSFEEPGRAMTVAALVAEADKYPRAIVEVTGGEPLTQAASVPLMAALVARGRAVLLETNGSLAVTAVPEGVHIILDVKCPGSGNAVFCVENLAEITRRMGFIEVKFVLSSREDYRFAVDFLREHPLPQTTPVFFSPVLERLSLADVAAWMLEDAAAEPSTLPPGCPRPRLSPQLHRLIWPGVERGR